MSRSLSQTEDTKKETRLIGFSIETFHLYQMKVFY